MIPKAAIENKEANLILKMTILFPYTAVSLYSLKNGKNK